MLRKYKITTPQEYIQTGMIFFLIGIAASMIADGRLVGAFFANLIQAGSLRSTIQGFADGISLPMFGASIFFYLRGLMMQRSR